MTLVKPQASATSHPKQTHEAERCLEFEESYPVIQEPLKKRCLCQKMPLTSSKQLETTSCLDTYLIHHWNSHLFQLLTMSNLLPSEFGSRFCLPSAMSNNSGQIRMMMMMMMMMMVSKFHIHSYSFDILLVLSIDPMTMDAHRCLDLRPMTLQLHHAWAGPSSAP